MKARAFVLLSLGLLLVLTYPSCIGQIQTDPAKIPHALTVSEKPPLSPDFPLLAFLEPDRIVSLKKPLDTRATSGAVVPLQIGANRKLPDVSLFGQFLSLASGNVGWIVKIRSVGANGLRLHFTDFHLPSGTQVIVYALDETNKPTAIMGPFSGQGPYEDGEFWSPMTTGVKGGLKLGQWGGVKADHFWML